MITGAKLRRFRKIKDLSIKEMANQLEIDESTYSRLERGETKITTEREEKVLKTFGITHDFLDNIEDAVSYSNTFQDQSYGNFINHQTITEKNTEVLTTLLRTMASIETQIATQTQANAKLIELLDKLITKINS